MWYYKFLFLVTSSSSLSPISRKLVDKFNSVRFDSYESIKCPYKEYDIQYNDLFRLEKINSYVDSKQSEIYYVKQKIRNDINKHFENFQMYSRIKSTSSIFSKISDSGNRQLDTINDILAIRIIVDNNEYYEMFKFISFIRRNYIIINIKDYITYPKENGYQSLHVSFFIPESEFPVEIQVRNHHMDYEANFGNASKYK